MGIAGANLESNSVLPAGVAGLLVGAFSMGAGKYVSMLVQREFYQSLRLHKVIRWRVIK